MKKRTFSFFMAMVMVIGLLPATVFAAGVDYTLVLCGGVARKNNVYGEVVTGSGITGVSSTDSLGIPTYRYTFDNVDFQTTAPVAISVEDERAVIDLVGTSSITGGNSGNSGTAGLRAENCVLSIGGNGTLNVTAGDSSFMYGLSDGIHCNQLNVNGGKINAVGGRSGEDATSSGIRGVNGVNIRGGTVYARGGRGSGTYGYSLGIYADSGYSNVCIEGGTVAAESDPDTNGFGLYTSDFGILEILGGNVTLKGSNCATGRFDYSEFDAVPEAPLTQGSNGSNNMVVTAGASESSAQTITGWVGDGNDNVSSYKYMKLTSAVASHEHDWTYVLSKSAAGQDYDTVVAECQDAAGCDYMGVDRSVTIVAPALTQVGGTGSPKATLTGSTLVGKHLNADDIQYTDLAADTPLTSAPTAAGEYQASFQAAPGKMIVVTYTITAPVVTPPVEPDPPGPSTGERTVLDVSKGYVSIGANELSAYAPDGTHLTEPDPDGYIITGTSTRKDNSVGISGGSHKLTLRDLNIVVSSSTWGHAFFVNGDTSLEVTLEGNNVLTGGAGRHGLTLEQDASVIFTDTSTGALTATGVTSSGVTGHGISSDKGDITIHGGSFNAKSIVSGSGTVTITGGSFAKGDAAANTVNGVAVASGCHVEQGSGDFPYTVVSDGSTITFDPNGGSGTMSAAIGITGMYNLPACTFTAPAGKQFKGWATAPDGDILVTDSISVNGDITLYAVWESSDTTPPTVSAFDVERTGDTTATVKFTPSEAGAYYYSVAMGSVGPTVDTNGAGFACTATEQTINLTTLTAGTAMISIVVKDEAGNLSARMGWEIPAYIPSAPDYTLVLAGGKVYMDRDLTDSANGTDITDVALDRFGISCGGGVYLFDSVDFFTTAGVAMDIRDASAAIELIGTNVVTGGEGDGINAVGLRAAGLTIDGTGSLAVTAGDALDNYCSYGICTGGDTLFCGGTVTTTGGIGYDSAGVCVASGTLAVTGGMLNAAAGYGQNNSWGVYTKGAVTVSGGTVTATGDEGSASYGLRVDFDTDGQSGQPVGRDLIVTGGTLTGKGGVAYTGYSSGVDVSGQIKVSQNGKLTGTGGLSDYYNSYGIRTASGMKVTGGTVIGTGGSAPQYDSYGILSEGDVAVSGGTVTATGGEGDYSCGLYTDYYYDGGLGQNVYHDLTVTGGTVTAKGGSANYYSSDGVYASGDVNISGGTVTAAGGISYDDGSYGLSAGLGLNVSGGKVTGSCGSAGYGSALYGETISITRGTVLGDATAPDAGYGLNFEKADGASITGGNVTLKGTGLVSAWWDEDSSTDNPVAPRTSNIYVTAGTGIDGSDAVSLDSWAGDGSDDVSGYRYMKLESGPDYTLYLYNKKVHMGDTAGPEITVPGISYADGAYVFNNVNFTTSNSLAMYSADEDITIKLVGNSSIKGGDSAGDNTMGLDQKGITFTGTGTLTITAGNTTKSEGRSTGISGYGIVVESGTLIVNGGSACYSDGICCNLTVNGGTAKATGGTGDKSSYGIYGGSVTTINGGTVEAVGGTVTGTGDYDISCGLAAQNQVVITGGTVKAIGGQGKTSYGHMAGMGATKITGGTVTMYGGTMGFLGSERAEYEYAPQTMVSGANVMLVDGGSAADGSDAARLTGWTGDGSDLVTAYQYLKFSAAPGKDEPYAIVLEGGKVSKAFESGIVLELTPGEASELGITGSTFVGLDGPGGGTYTFKNVNFETTALSAVQINDDNAILMLEGTNTLKAGSGDVSAGIYTLGNLTINSTGSGSLDITAGAGASESIGIVAMSLNVAGGAVNAASGAAKNSYGLRVYGPITVTGGELTAKADIGTAGSEGIRAESLTVEAGSVKSSGAPSAGAESSGGIYAEQFTIRGGTVVVIGSTAKQSYGLYTSKTTVEGGSLTATAGEAELYSYGIVAGENLAVSGGTVKATGGKVTGTAAECTSGGVYLNFGLNITGGTVTATGGQATRSYGIDAGQIYNITGGAVTLVGGTGAGSFSGAMGQNAPMTQVSGVNQMTVRAGSSADKSQILFNWKGDGQDNARAYKYMYLTVEKNKVTITGATKTAVSVTAKCESGAKLMVARYDGGKMTAVKVLTGTIPQSIELGGTGTVVKAFLVNGDYQPLCLAASCTVAG